MTTILLNLICVSNVFPKISDDWSLNLFGSNGQVLVIALNFKNSLKESDLWWVVQFHVDFHNNS